MLSLFLFWAVTVPLVRYVAELLGSYTTLSFTLLLSSFFALTFEFFKSQQKGNFNFFKNREFYFRTILYSSYWGLIYFGINSIERSKLPLVILLNYLWPTMTMILSVYLLKVPFRPLLLFLGSAFVVTAIGMEIAGENLFWLLTESGDIKTVLIYVVVFISAIVWAFYSVLNRKWGIKAGGGSALPFMFLFTSAAAFIGRTISHEQSHFSLRAIGCAACIALFGFFANFCWDIGTRRGNINILSLFADFLPWGSLLASYLVLDITITPRAWLSAIIVVIGALISRWSLLSAKPKEVTILD